MNLEFKNFWIMEDETPKRVIVALNIFQGIKQKLQQETKSKNNVTIKKLTSHIKKKK